jgi:hypothetical protein
MTRKALVWFAMVSMVLFALGCGGGGGGGGGEDSTGDETGVETGVETGTETGVETGDTTGDETGDTTGDETGDTTGDETGDTAGDETGDTTGDETGDTTGDETGDTTGDETGDTTGDETSVETGEETGEETGGAGFPCTFDSECTSGECADGICTLPEHCSDGLKTGDEPGADCGGSCLFKCQDNQPCFVAGDCENGCCNSIGVCDGDADGDGTCNQNDKCAVNFLEPDCDECAGNFTGANCDECVGNFTGANCDECKDPKFEADECYLAVVDACTNEADAAILSSLNDNGHENGDDISSAGIKTQAAYCFLGCVDPEEDLQEQDIDTISKCTVDCLSEAVGISSKCASCYGDEFYCQFSNCTACSGSGPDSNQFCEDCDAEYQCSASLSICSGI